jgi:hypothetical protein
VLSYVEGISGKEAWAKVVPDCGLYDFAKLLPAYHDAVTSRRLAPCAQHHYATPMAHNSVIGIATLIGRLAARMLTETLVYDTSPSH